MILPRPESARHPPGAGMLGVARDSAWVSC